MKKISCCLAILCAVYGSFSQADNLRYEGSSTVGKFITDAQSHYAKSGISIKTQSESSGGEKCVAFGNCDIGGVARQVNETYLNKGVKATLIGKDAIAAIVHPDNPVQSLSAAQLKAVFQGEVSNWSELGGQDIPVKVFIVKKGSATRKVFANVIMDGAAYGKQAKVVTPDAKIVRTVAREVGAIGQISFAFLGADAKVKPLDVGDQAATVENPDYPITRPLYLATKGEPAGSAKSFIDWALTKEGQTILKQRFVGI